jgi:superfamily I DNA/RNA helicase
MEAEMTLRPMTAAEQMYSYSQSQQISMQTGLIGYLRADMDSNGKGFFSSWNGFRDSLKSEDFKLEFDEVLIPQADDRTYSSRYDRSLLYIACTRAMHRLTLTYTGRITPLAVRK